MDKKEKDVKKKSHILRKILFCFLIAIVVAAGVAFLAVAHFLNSIERGNEELKPAELAVYEGLPEEIINLAVFGVDSRSNEVSGRSDAMMIVSVDMQHNKIKAVSIMRDSLVDIDGYGARKINSAYALGGVELAVKTLNQNFNMNITDYVSLNFNQLAGVVDALGGVEVEISEAERKNANKYIKEMADEAGVDADLIKESGNVTLYGYQAVAYARIRYVGNADFERTERQREIMEKLMNKILDAGVSRYPALVKNLAPMVKTSLSDAEILRIAGSIALKGKPTFEQGRFPVDGSYETNKNYSMVYDLDAAAEKLHRFIYDDEAFYE